MNRLLTGLAALALTVPLAAQQTTPPADRDRPTPGPGGLPPGWQARTDEPGAAGSVRMTSTGQGFEAAMGTAAILYRDQDAVTGKFHTLASFTQTRAPAHPEGYGLFFGGRDLQAEGVRYVYFLVRGDGMFLVKRRDGKNTTELTKGWTANPAVARAGPAGTATNKLEIDASGSRVNFVINGQVVFSADAAALPLDGVVGLRVNHNLDVRIDGFALHRI